MHVYQADVWCDDCGRLLEDDLTAAGKVDTGDSNDWPQPADDDCETDCPHFCGGCAEFIGAGGRRVRVLWVPAGDHVEVEKNERADHKAMDEIHALLDGTEWDADTLEAVADVVRRSGRSVDEPHA